MNWKKKLFTFLRIAVSVTLIAWFLYLLDTENLIQALVGANLFYILLVVLLAILDRVLMAYKWNLLLMAKEIRIPLLNVISTYFKASFFGNLILPSIGADAIRIFEISRQTKKTEHIISSVVIERVIGMLGVALVGLFGLVLYTGSVDGSGWRNMLVILAIMVLAGLVFLLSLNKERFVWLQKWLANSRWRIVRKIENVLVSYQDYAQHPRVLLGFLTLTVLEQLIPVFSAYLVSQAIQANISFVTFLIFVPVIIAIVRLPISFDGFGVQEALYISMFGLIGIQEEYAFLIGFLPPILARLAIVVPTLYFFWSDKASPGPSELGAIKPAVKEEEESNFHANEVGVERFGGEKAHRSAE